MIRTTTFTNATEKKISIFLLISIVSFSFLYVFFIGVMSVSAVKMSSIGKEIRTRSADISNLEEKYMELTSNITLSYAYSLGFREPKVIAYASRKTFAINFNNERK